MALKALCYWFISQMDVHDKFIQGDLPEKIYMQIPKGFTNQGEKYMVCKLHKYLYGLNHAPRQWNLRPTETLIDMGFLQ